MFNITVCYIQGAKCLSLSWSTGIGWSSGKKLALMGVNSIADLKSISMETLQEEFGVSMATTMKNLCEGIDDSPVVTTGLPQV